LSKFFFKGEISGIDIYPMLGGFMGENTISSKNISNVNLGLNQPRIESRCFSTQLFKDRATQRQDDEANVQAI
jgi:hypothetical protein